MRTSRLIECLAFASALTIGTAMAAGAPTAATAGKHPSATGTTATSGFHPQVDPLGPRSHLGSDIAKPTASTGFGSDIARPTASNGFQPQADPLGRGGSTAPTATPARTWRLIPPPAKGNANSPANVNRPIDPKPQNTVSD